MLMIRKAGLATLFTVLGSLTLAGMAQANLYNLDVVGVPTDGQFGSYHVVINDINDTSFQILSIQANSGANTPTSDVFRVRMYFYTGSNGTGTNLSSVGLTPGNMAGVDPAGTNWGPGGVNHGGAGGFSNYAEYYNISSNHGVGPNNLLADGSNIWTQNGAFTVGPGVGSFIVQLNDGEAYLGTGNVPEASSLALLLPGLVPLGFILRRRYTRK